MLDHLHLLLMINQKILPFVSLNLQSFLEFLNDQMVFPYSTNKKMIFVLRSYWQRIIFNSLNHSNHHYFNQLLLAIQTLKCYLHPFRFVTNLILIQISFSLTKIIIYCNGLFLVLVILVPIINYGFIISSFFHFI